MDSLVLCTLLSQVYLYHNSWFLQVRKLLKPNLDHELSSTAFSVHVLLLQVPLGSSAHWRALQSDRDGFQNLVKVKGDGDTAVLNKEENLR